jgi:hypothetical protein
MEEGKTFYRYTIINISRMPHQHPAGFSGWANHTGREQTSSSPSELFYPRAALWLCKPFMLFVPSMAKIHYLQSNQSEIRDEYKP